MNTKQQNDCKLDKGFNTLNINGLNSPTKRHRGSKWTQKQDPSVWCLQESIGKWVPSQCDQESSRHSLLISDKQTSN